MGIDPVTIAFVASLAVGYESNRRITSQQQKATRAAKKANRIKTNQEKYKQAQEARQRIRARRLRIAQLASQSESGGVVGSSGQLGAISAASAKTNANIGAGNADNAFTSAIQKQSNLITQSESNIAQIGAETQLKQQVIGGFKTIFG